MDFDVIVDFPAKTMSPLATVSILCTVTLVGSLGVRSRQLLVRATRWFRRRDEEVVSEQSS